jgi:hypothetical protein
VGSWAPGRGLALDALAPTRHPVGVALTVRNSLLNGYLQGIFCVLQGIYSSCQRKRSCCSSDLPENSLRKGAGNFLGLPGDARTLNREEQGSDDQALRFAVTPTNPY